MTMKDFAKIRYMLAAAALALGWVPAAAALAADANSCVAQIAATYLEIKWADLTPKGWDPNASGRALSGAPYP
jgi:hypothetical protein